MENNKQIGLDVGGSHVCAGIIDLNYPDKPPMHLIRREINAFDTASNIINTIGLCIKELLDSDNNINGVGIAFPGPFDYAKGISAIGMVGGKFEQTFGLHVQQALKDCVGKMQIPFRFSNDAHCFAKGAWHRHQLKSNKTVFLTLGTGFGSAFMEEGVLVTDHPALPPGAVFFNVDFLNAKADDYFSTRWFLKEYLGKTGSEISGVKELAEINTEITHEIFNRFGSNLGDFLLPWLNQFECDELVIGGNISNAASLFNSALNTALAQLIKPIQITYCPDTEDCILTGAAIVAEENNSHNNKADSFKTKRKTTQLVLPLTVAGGNQSGYDVFPSFPSKYPIRKGFDSLAEFIGKEKTVVIDGYGGVLWEEFREQLHHALLAKNKRVFWYNIDACLHSPEKFNAMLEANLNGDDPVFGKKYTGNLIDFFDKELLGLLQPDATVDLCILYGTGAALANWKGPLIYIDIPKNEIQYRMRASSIFNLGSNKLFANTQIYKRFYFVDWPVLNKHKEQLLPAIDCIVDEQRMSEITWMQGNDFRTTLDEMLEQPLRARPWFEAGVWGGNWMKKRFAGLNKDEVNYAWSFELITPENGIVIEGNQYLLEVSFDYLLFRNNKKLLGKAANRFGTEFPIRLDFLDTYDGGNLSIQCHPRTNYIRENFGENFTQDETYYILDCEPDANVYLGFQDDIDPVEFKTALLDAQINSAELPVEKYIQKLPAHKHDLFLIPNGTIHASGKNNMVLEISNTPYIYTFKMYDWQRLDLNGQPRPINIEHAFNNLYFDHKGEYVQQHLVSKPTITNEWINGRKVKLPTHEEHFYAVDRYEFTGTIQIETNGQCHICMLVEGEEIEVIVNEKNTSFQYAETFVIPAAVKGYELKSNGNKQAFVVVAYMKDEYC
jgi:mannose-6-phosphate isomerase class I/predicted NBD/HSP70 family sugar kinase